MGRNLQRTKKIATGLCGLAIGMLLSIGMARAQSITAGGTVRVPSTGTDRTQSVPWVDKVRQKKIVKQSVQQPAQQPWFAKERAAAVEQRIVASAAPASSAAPVAASAEPGRVAATVTAGSATLSAGTPPSTVRSVESAAPAAPAQATPPQISAQATQARVAVQSAPAQASPAQAAPQRTTLSAQSPTITAKQDVLKLGEVKAESGPSRSTLSAGSSDPQVQAPSNILSQNVKPADGATRVASGTPRTETGIRPAVTDTRISGETRVADTRGTEGEASTGEQAASRGESGRSQPPLSAAQGTYPRVIQLPQPLPRQEGSATSRPTTEPAVEGARTTGAGGTRPASEPVTRPMTEPIARPATDREGVTEQRGERLDGRVADGGTRPTDGGRAATPEQLATETETDCTSRLFDCDKKIVQHFTGRVVGLARLGEKLVAVLVSQLDLGTRLLPPAEAPVREVAPVRETDAGRDAAPDATPTTRPATTTAIVTPPAALFFVRTHDRTIAGCGLPMSAYRLMKAQFGPTDGEGDDLVILREGGVGIMRHATSAVDQSKLGWAAIGQELQRSLPLCTEVGIAVTSQWSVSNGGILYDAQVASDQLLALVGKPAAAGTRGDEGVAVGLTRLSLQNGELTGKDIALPVRIVASRSMRLRTSSGDARTEMQISVSGVDALEHTTCALSAVWELSECQKLQGVAPAKEIKAKGWSSPFLFYDDGKIVKKGAGEPAPRELARGGAWVYGLGLGPFEKREESVGLRKGLRVIRDNDLLSIAEEKGVRLARSTAEDIKKIEGEFFGCNEGGCVPYLEPAVVHIDSLGGPDLVYAGRHSIILLPNRTEAPSARVLIVGGALKADRICAAGEECTCAWKLTDQNGVDRTFQLKNPAECETGMNLTGEAPMEAEEIPSLLSRMGKYLVRDAFAESTILDVQLTVSNRDYSTTAVGRITGTAADQLIAGPGQGEDLATVDDLTAALQADGAIPPGTKAVDQSVLLAAGKVGEPMVERAELPGGTIVAGEGAKNASQADLGGWETAGACALIQHPFPMKPAVGLWLIFVLPALFLIPVRVHVQKGGWKENRRLRLKQ